MSLINEALKRARLLRKPPEGEVPPEGANPPEPPDPSEPPLEPVEEDPAPKRSSKLLVPLCVALAVCGIWFLWKWWSDPGVTPKTGPVQASVSAKPELPATPVSEGQSQTAVSDATQTSEPADPGPVTSEPQTPVAAVRGESPEPVTETDGVASATPEAPVVAARESQPAVVEAVASTETEAPPPEPVFDLQPARPVNFPPLKLQGIFFRLHNPSVLINNRTLFIGSKVDGVTVTEIKRTKVVLELGGARKELFLK
ncbi:MAG: hypothetical protein K9N62_16240 [Verrucomicrobia bacterium]|nr:hypothetical protein [Verrucomicrobiota bacterium]